MEKIHIEGDPKLKNNPGKQFSMFIGRWQPWHDGHRWLIDQRLEQGKNVLICIRDIQPDEKNPFTTEQTVEMIEKYHNAKGDDVKVMDAEGNMMRRNELFVMAKEKQMKIISIQQIIDYRIQTENHLISISKSSLPTKFANFGMEVLKNTLTGTEHLLI